MQLCAGLEADIEGETHAVGQRRLERARQRRREEEARIPDEDEDEDEAARDERLIVKTEGIEEEAAEIKEEALRMEVKEEVEGEEKGDGNLRAQGSIESRNQEAEPSGTTIVDVRNGFNKMSRLEIL